MALHDWSDDSSWEALHTFWLVRLADSIRPQLPTGYRVCVGTYGRIAFDLIKPIVGVTQPFPTKLDRPEMFSPQFEPDRESTVTATLDPHKAVFVQKNGIMVSALEVISPANKDRTSSRSESTARYAGYLRGGIHLAVIDLLPKPLSFSFHAEIAADIGLADEPALPPPMAVAYRVGEALDTGGSRIAVWRRPMTVGQPLPTLPLPLSIHASIPLDLDKTYTEAAESAYLN